MVEVGVVGKRAVLHSLVDALAVGLLVARQRDTGYIGPLLQRVLHSRFRPRKKALVIDASSGVRRSETLAWQYHVTSAAHDVWHIFLSAVRLGTHAAPYTLVHLLVAWEGDGLHPRVVHLFLWCVFLRTNFLQEDLLGPLCLVKFIPPTSELFAQLGKSTEAVIMFLIVFFGHIV